MSGIVPAAVAVDEIRGAIEASWGDVLGSGEALICNTPPGASKLPQLTEVRLCINKTTLRPIQGCSTLYSRVESPNRCTQLAARAYSLLPALPSCPLCTRLHRQECRYAA